MNLAKNRPVAEGMRADSRATVSQCYRLGGFFWYVWNEPDRDSIYRGGVLMEAGRLAVAPMPAH